MAGGFMNKLVMAVLTAMLIAMLAGFLAGQIVHTPQLAENVYKVELPETQVAKAEPAAAGPPLEPVGPLLASASVDAGAKISRQCAACHSFDQGGAARVGPNLWNIVNAPHAHMEGFNYSDALKKLSDKPWDYEALNAFLANPKAAVPGTKMAYAGLKDVKDRANLIAWLRTQAPTPAPLP